MMTAVMVFRVVMMVVAVAIVLVLVGMRVRVMRRPEGKRIGEIVPLFRTTENFVVG